MPQPRQPDARQLAARSVLAVVEDGQMLTESPGTDPQTRAAALRLAQAVLRNYARTDSLLTPHLRKQPPPAVMALLRVAVVDMLDQGAPAHGVVSAVVGAFRANPDTGRFAGMANAVLRKVATVEGWHDMPVQRLPGWLRRRLRGIHGEETIQAIEAAHHAGAALDLTLKPGTTAPAGEALPGGSVRIATPVQVSALPGYDTGDWWVQDAAAALPALLLDARPDETVLDLCAAPGGKTMQLAAAGAQVSAVDLSEARLKRLRANLERTGLHANVIAADLLEWAPEAPIDAVLLDAPCSATGTIRRHPDLPFLRKPADVAALTDLQTRLIDRATTFLKPGGRLVYCTCSLLPDEGEMQVAAALDRLPLEPLPLPPLPFGRATPEGGWRTLPHDLRGGNDGFYMALLRRTDA